MVNLRNLKLAALTGLALVLSNEINTHPSRVFKENYQPAQVAVPYSNKKIINPKTIPQVNYEEPRLLEIDENNLRPIKVNNQDNSNRDYKPFPDHTVPGYNTSPDA